MPARIPSPRGALAAALLVVATASLCFWQTPTPTAVSLGDTAPGGHASLVFSPLLSAPGVPSTTVDLSALPTSVSAASASDPRITRFNDWLMARRRGENPPPALGLELARARRAAFKELIMADPRRAVEQAVPRPVRSELPESILAELETPIDTFARFEVLAHCLGPAARTERIALIEGRPLIAHVFGRRLATLSHDRLAIHGYILDERVLIDETPFRLADPTEPAGRAALASGLIAAAIGDDFQSFGSYAELITWSETVARDEINPNAPRNGVATAAATAAWTHGEKNVLWIRAEFPDDPVLPATDEAIRSSMARVSDFYLDVSNGRSSFKTTILPGALRVSKPKAAYNTSTGGSQLRDEVGLLARAYDEANGRTGAFNPDRHDRWIVLANRLSNLGVAGFAGVGGSSVFLNGTIADSVVAHELGHNHGLNHADGWKPSGLAPAGAGEHSPYGDVFDVMGSGTLLPGAHFSSKAKEILLYLETAHTPIITTSGTYRIFRHDHRNATGVRALRIAAGNYEFWLERRWQSPAVSFPNTARLQDGLVVMWSRYPATLDGLGTYLLDAAPGTPGVAGSPGSSAGFNDASLAIGQTFADPDRGISIAPTAKGGDAPGEWIDVRIDFGATGANRNPTLAATRPGATVLARSDVVFQATASDPDGDPLTVRWNFSGIPPERTGARVTHRFIKGGPHSAQCTAVDGRGGFATDTFTVNVEDPLLAWVRRGTGVTPQSLSSVVHDGRQFIASGTGILLSSPDGVTWTRQHVTSNETYDDLATSGATTVVVGAKRNLPNPPHAAAILYTHDGITWQAASFTTTATDLGQVAYGANRFVTVGVGGAILHSADGIAWTSAISGTTQDLRCVRFGGGRFVATGLSGAILTSADGITWTNRTGATTAPLVQLAYHRGQWIAPVLTFSLVSSNGLDWATQLLTTRTSLRSFTSLGNSDLLFAFAGDDVIHLSEDGLNWDSFAIGTTAGWMTGACAGNGAVVVVGTGGRIFQSSLQPVPPAVVSPPRSQTVYVSQSITLTVEASGTGLRFQWLKNGVPIPGATNASYTIASMSANDAGSYAVAITNLGGTITTAAATIALSSEIPLAFTTITGALRVAATVDGSFADARFNAPGGIAVDRAGSLYISDVSTHVIRKISTTGEVTTVAGLAGTAGAVDGPGAIARFSLPRSIAVDRDGHLYIADTNNSTVRKISPSGIVSTLAGLARSQGIVDGVGASARFVGPGGIACDEEGNLYVTDMSAHTIRKISPEGRVTTLAGSGREAGSADGTGASARFNRPVAIAVDGSGHLYVADQGNHILRRISPEGVVTTLAGQAEASAHVDGTGTAARFISPASIALDPSGNVYVASSSTVRKMTPEGVVSTVGGAPATSAYVDGLATAARFSSTLAIAGDAIGTLYLADTANALVRKGTPLGRRGAQLANLSVRTFAGADSATLIVGFSVEGGTKPVLLRTIGPTLREFGIPDAHPDPNLQLEQQGTLLAQNDDWHVPAGSPPGASADAIRVAAQDTGAFVLPSESRDAALLQTLAAGGYTALVGGGTGIALVELYDTGTPGSSRLGNVSARTRAGAGDDALVVGFVVGGDSPKKVLIRAVGPTLASFDIEGALANPHLELFRDNMTVADNRAWGGAATLATTFSRVGAFELPTTSRDAVLLVTLLPGAYTAQVTSASGPSGIALVEIYDMP